MIVGLGALVAIIWIVLVFGRDGFWRNDQGLLARWPEQSPTILALVPARNEAATIEACVQSLLRQDYDGELVIVVVDDESTDGTAALAKATAMNAERTVQVVTVSGKPPGWSGKVAAQEAGLDAAERLGLEGSWLWLTDADIVHAPDVLARLMATAEKKRCTLVSVMAQLSTINLCERWLVPAFVYFFQMLYPFPAVNDPKRTTAAAAGGCVLVERTAFDRVGGFAAIHDELIDDIALATEIKRARGRLWLATDPGCVSLRRYDLRGFAAMVVRTAFTELRYSYVRLVVAIVGMAVVFLAPPALALLAAGSSRVLGVVALGLMAVSYGPILRAYRLPLWWLAALPAAAVAYMAMTVSSAWRHARGSGAVWHGRSYGERTEGGASPRS